MPTQSWRGKSAVFCIYSALTSNGYRKSIKAVRWQRNLGLLFSMTEFLVFFTRPYLYWLPTHMYIYHLSLGDNNYHLLMKYTSPLVSLNTCELRCASNLIRCHLLANFADSQCPFFRSIPFGRGSNYQCIINIYNY